MLITTSLSSHLSIGYWLLERFTVSFVPSRRHGICVMRGESKTYTTCVLHEQSATISYICQGMSNICGYAKSVMTQVAIFKLQQIFLSLSSSFAFNSPQGWALKHLIEALLYFSVFCSFVHVFLLLLITVSNSPNDLLRALIFLLPSLYTRGWTVFYR